MPVPPPPPTGLKYASADCRLGWVGGGGASGAGCRLEDGGRGRVEMLLRLKVNIVTRHVLNLDAGRHLWFGLPYSAEIPVNIVINR
jgi:hypothetical protein